MKTLLLSLVLAGVQDPGEVRELGERIAELKAVLEDTADESKRTRIRASIDRLETRLKRIREGKIRPEAEPENEEEELARIEREMTARLEANPGDVGARVERAEIRLMRNRPRDALVDLRKAIEIEPEEPFFHILAGRAHLLLGDEKEARGAFARAVAIEPEAREAVDELLGEVAPDKRAMMMKSVMAMNAPKKPDPKEVAARLKRNPRDVEALVLRARIRLAEGDPDGALDDLYAAVKIDPSHAPAFFQRAVTHASQGRLEFAERDLWRGERRMKPGQRAEFRRAERSVRAADARREARTASPEERAELIRSLRERREELAALSSADARERLRALDAELERLAEAPPPDEDGGEELDRAHERMEVLEGELESLSDRYRAASSADARRGLEAKLREKAREFHELRHRIVKRELQHLRQELRDLENEKSLLVEEHVRELMNREEE